MGVYVLQNQCNSGGRFCSSLDKVEVVSKLIVNGSNTFGHLGNLLELVEIHRHSFSRVVVEERWLEEPCPPSERVWVVYLVSRIVAAFGEVQRTRKSQINVATSGETYLRQDKENEVK